VSEVGGQSRLAATRITEDQRARLSAIWNVSLEALAKVVRDFEITETDLHEAGQFFNRMGSAGCFPSLLDLAFATTALASAGPSPATRANIEGPYYLAGAPIRPGGSLFDRAPGRDARLCVIRGRVTGAVDGSPIAGAVVDLWQADEQGVYDTDGYHLRGKVITDDSGSYRANTLVPPDYPQHQHDPVGELLVALGRQVYRPAHIHLKVWVDDQERLTTQVFMAHSPFLRSDYVVGAVSDDLTIDVVVEESDTDPPIQTLTFDIALAPLGSRS
jgi:protocatechuate 3,4-dioxygenase beta subunit